MAECDCGIEYDNTMDRIELERQLRYFEEDEKKARGGAGSAGGLAATAACCHHGRLRASSSR